jgi:LruC domain-containing protein
MKTSLRFSQLSKNIFRISAIAALMLTANFTQAQGTRNPVARFNESVKNSIKPGKSDIDGDGVPDSNDAYPQDATKAFNNCYPAKGMSTLLFEDLWPFKGDYDFNDLVVDYRFNTITDASNNVTQIDYKFLLKASGAVAKNGFAFQLDGIASDKILSVAGNRMTPGWSALNNNGTEAGQAVNANIIVFDYASKIFNGSVPAGSTANTFINSPLYKADTITISVKFYPGKLSFATLTPLKFNPYLIADQNRGREVHLPNRMPSAKMDVSWFGKGDDNSNIAKGIYFKAKNNQPWALEISSSIPYAQEKVDFSKAYPNFFSWGESKGKNNTDWFTDKPGNRDLSKLYLK